MNPVAVTFVDDKMLAIAKDQAKNFNDFGIEHEIVRIPETTYSTKLWMDITNLTIAAIKRHKKIISLDAEIRIHKPLPNTWIENDNVLFQPWPYVKDPFYLAVNAGQMVLGESGIEFLEVIKKCMTAMVAPDGDTRVTTGENHVVERETPSGIAIALSGIKYHSERLSYDRRLAANSTANRGLWLEENTVLTHPALHNWNWLGAGLSKFEDQITLNVFVNHFAPLWELKRVVLLAKLLASQNVNYNLWESFATHQSGGIWEAEGWQFSPIEGKCAPIGMRLKKLTT